MTRDTIVAELRKTEDEIADLEAKIRGILADTEDLEHYGYLQGYRDGLGRALTELADHEEADRLDTALGLTEGDT